jgi:heavy metal sensor kinase
MKPFRSIRWRLQLWYGLLIATLLSGFGFTAYNFERNVQLTRIDDELERLAYQLRGANSRRPPTAAETDAPRRAKPPPEPGEVVTPEHVERGFYYAVWTKNRVPFTPSANAPAELPKPPDGTALRWRGTRREAFTVGNPGDIVLVGRDAAPDLAALRRFRWQLVAAGSSALILTVFIGAWLTTRALRPIRDISDAAQTIATGDLARRINTKDTDSELGELATVLNTTFARLDAAFTQQARFTADAAHELRTPLTVILTHVQNALGTENVSDEQREALEACQRAAQRMRRLIESLLRLARIDAGQEGREHAALDVAAVARECVQLIEPMAASRKISVHVDLAPAMTRGDHDGFSQVVTNLLANAVHHNRDAGEIHVTTHADNGHAVLVVADNGPGIAAVHLPHIFERFYRVDKARTASAGRTGLGLAIVKAIVDAHGGEIEAESTPGAGARFTVRLPAAG